MILNKICHRDLLLNVVAITLACSVGVAAELRLTLPQFRERVELRWSANVNQPHTVFASTNLLEGFFPVASGIQATPPSNAWWMSTDAPARFFKLRSDAAVENPVVNGDFSNGLEHWIKAGPGQALFAPSGGLLFVDITDGGTVQWHVALRQSGLVLENGTGYLIELDARAAAPRTMEVRLQNTDGTVNYLVQVLTLGTGLTTFQIPFTMTATTDPGVRLHLGFGADNHNVWIGNIGLRTGGLRDAARNLNTRMARGNNFMAAKAMLNQGAPEDYRLLNRHGFAHARIGFKLYEVCGGSPDYIVQASAMQVLQNLVDWCLTEGLIAVIDPLHWWTQPQVAFSYTHPGDLLKLGKIWEQVADRFAAYSSEQVVFEIINEPRANNNIAAIIETALAAIRSQPGNERRMVIVSGEGFTTRQALINAFDQDKFPPADPFLIATFHYYDPKGFTHCATDTFPSYTWSGTPQQLTQIQSDFSAVVTANNNWAARHGTEPLPVYLGEFGVDNVVDSHTADRKRWLSRVRMQAEAHGFSWAHWNMYNNEPSSKGMGPWTATQRATPSARTLDPDPVEALVGRYEAENGSFGGGVAASAEHPGFTGTGYAVFPDTSGTEAWARVDGIYIPAGCVYAVHCHYSSAADRVLRLTSRNETGDIVAEVARTFPATGGPGNWRTQVIEIGFQAGDQASLTFTADAGPGVQLDWVWLTLS